MSDTVSLFAPVFSLLHIIYLNIHYKYVLQRVVFFTVEMETSVNGKKLFPLTKTKTETKKF